MVDGGLHLHRIVLRDPLGLQRLARERNLPDHPFDADYVVHSLLAELAGRERVKPFVRDPRSQGTSVLAYSTLDAETLHDQAQAIAPPEVYQLIDWEHTQAKPMPTSWSRGRRLGYRVRVCPLVRGPKGHGSNGQPVRKERPEVDAWLARAWQEEEPPEREQVYREWLDRELARGGAAHIEHAELKGFRLRQGLRRDGDRKARAIRRPDALFEGTLLVGDPQAFGELLARGLGRHRGFGFGMLLLTAPG